MNLLDVGKTIKLNHIDLIKGSVVIPCNSFGKIKDWNYNLITLAFKVSDEVKEITDYVRKAHSFRCGMDSTNT